MKNEEIVGFYQEQMTHLKNQFYMNQSENEQLLFEKKNLENQNQILKENNDNITDMFSQYQNATQNQIRDLEFLVAKLSVERADKELEVDSLLQELKKQKRKCQEKEIQIKEYQEQQQKIDSPDNLSVSSFDDANYKKQVSIDSKPESIIYLKKSFHTPSKNNKPDIQQIILDSIQKCSYTILYEEEMNKINDVSNKKFELKIWQDQVMNLFEEKYKNTKLLNQKLKDLLRNSYPEQFRGKIWPFLVGNQLQITKTLYYKLLDSVPNHPLVNQELLTLINNDLQRTFSIINDFKDSNRLKDDLREILILFHIYRPDVGYVQGMTYLVFMFLIRMPKHKSLKCFANLLFKSQMLRTLYQFKSHYLDAYFSCFNSYFQEKLPILNNRFEELNLPKQSFLVEWYYTVFARAFNLITSSKIWDHFLCEGDIFLFKLPLAILSILEPELMQCDFDDILTNLKSKTYQIKSAELFKAIYKIKIENKDFIAKLAKELEKL